MTVHLNRDTDPTLRTVLDELSRREPIFHRPEFGTARAHFERMTTDDFFEVGASGRLYTRSEVLDILETRHQSPIVESLEASGFQCRRLAQDTYLLTYYLIQEKTRHTRRATIWQHTEEGWKIAYHQGTIVLGS